MFRYEFLDI